MPPPLSARLHSIPGQYNRNTIIIKDPLSGDLLTHNFNHFMIADHKTHQIYSSSDSLPEHPLLRQLWKLYGNSNKLRYILMDSDHNLWISTWTQWLHRYNMDTHVLTTYSLKDIVKQETGIDNRPSKKSMAGYRLCRLAEV